LSYGRLGNGKDAAMMAFQSRIMMTAFLLLAGTLRLSAAPSPELSLERALVVEGSAELDLSGLHFHQGKLLAVSDKVDDTVYEIVVDPKGARIKTHRRFTPPAAPSVKMDWEALQSGPDGVLYLASEKNGRIATLSPKARKAVWLTPPTECGGISDPAAGIEGLAFLDKDHLLLAKEREPRGLVEWTRGTFTWFPLIETRLPLPPGRTPDFADLHADQGRVFALARNSEMLVELRKEKKTWTEGKAWSFSQSVRDPRYAYLADKFGQAEGLAMDDQRIYLVIDNNRSGRVADPKDRRATLFIFARPVD